MALILGHGGEGGVALQRAVIHGGAGQRPLLLQGVELVDGLRLNGQRAVVVADAILRLRLDPRQPLPAAISVAEFAFLRHFPLVSTQIQLSIYQQNSV